MKLRGWRLLFAGLLLALIVATDFAIKEWAFYHVAPMNDAPFPYGGLPLFHNFLGIDLSLNLVFNYGMAYGLFAAQTKLLLGLRLALILFLAFHLIAINRNKATHFPWVMIIAGAAANVVDVFRRGYVIDMFHFKFWGMAPFAIFNLADFFISIGICCLIFYSYLFRRNDSCTLKT